MAAARALPLKAQEVEAWCHEAASPTARKTTWNLVRELFRTGDSEASLLWWLREEGRVLGRLLLARDGDDLRVGFLSLPWDGAWSGSLRRLLEAVVADARRRGAAHLLVPEDALELPAPATFAQRLAELGFVEDPACCLVRVHRCFQAGRALEAPPAGAGLDGDQGRWSPAPTDPRILAAGLEALGTHGALDVWLEWPLAESVPELPAGWLLEEELRPRLWRVALDKSQG